MISAGSALAGALWHSAGDDWLSYDTETGETQLLSGLARFVLDQVQAAAAPVSSEQLIELVHAEEPEFTRGDCAEAVTQAIQALQSARLLTVGRVLGDTMSAV